MTAPTRPIHVPSWRHCCYPDCPARFDAIAVFGGDRVAAVAGGWQPGWVMKVLSLNYLCPDHATTPHLPSRDGRLVACGCGWTSAEMQTLGDMLATWRRHVVHATREDQP